MNLEGPDSKAGMAPGNCCLRPARKRRARRQRVLDLTRRDWPAPIEQVLQLATEADHRLTTESPSTNFDNGGQTQAMVVVFVDLFDRYLRSGRRGRRFKSCHSDQEIPPKSLAFWF
jgi:hypothetical protein